MRHRTTRLSKQRICYQTGEKEQTKPTVVHLTAIFRRPGNHLRHRPYKSFPLARPSRFRRRIRCLLHSSPCRKILSPHRHRLLPLLPRLHLIRHPIRTIRLLIFRRSGVPPGFILALSEARLPRWRWFSASWSGSQCAPPLVRRASIWVEAVSR